MPVDEGEGELAPLEPLLLVDPPLAEPVVPAGGCMGGLVQAASQNVAAIPTTRVTVRCLYMDPGPLIRYMEV